MSTPRANVTICMGMSLGICLAISGCHQDTGEGSVSAASTQAGDACNTCHGDAYESALFAHASVGYGRACGRCHRKADWQPTWRLDHDPLFVLVDGHRDLACQACHRGQGAPAETGCVSCHAADRDAAQPAHQGFPDECTLCHTAKAWRPSSYPGHDTIYPLLGAHAELVCGACHPGGVFAGTERTCVGCHAAARDAARPDHTGLGDDCTTCHRQDAWRPASLDHGRFPLDGAHLDAPCGACHVDGVFAGTPRTCVGCHGENRAGVQPDHADFPDACDACHSTTAWRPAAFAGHDEYWTLEGAHRTVECGACHAGGVYAGTPRDCVGCHREDASRADPSHADFPDDCARCHGQTGWRPWNHRFPTRHYTARACGDCHRERDAFVTFSCIYHHEHGQARMEREHRGETRGFRWESEACLRCHPNGRE